MRFDGGMHVNRAHAAVKTDREKEHTGASARRAPDHFGARTPEEEKNRSRRTRYCRKTTTEYSCMWSTHHPSSLAPHKLQIQSNICTSNYKYNRFIQQRYRPNTLREAKREDSVSVVAAGDN